jgi:RNA polymerase primary sigma factor
VVNKIRSNQGKHTFRPFGRTPWSFSSKIPLDREDRAYMESLNENGSFKIKILSFDTQARLAILAKYGDTQALDRLVRTNIGLVIYIAKRYVNRGFPLSELVHIGNQGFIPAIGTFDPTKGNFATHVTHWIRQRISVSLGEQSVIRIPPNRLSAWNKIGKKIDVLRKELEREPYAEEIIRRFDLPADEVEEYLRMSNWPSSLDAPAQNIGKYQYGKNNALGDIVRDHTILPPDKETFQNILKERMEKVLGQLTELERTIIKSRFELNGTPFQTYKQLGKDLSISHEKARNIEKKGKKKLRGIWKQYREGF